MLRVSGRLSCRGTFAWRVFNRPKVKGDTGMPTNDARTLVEALANHNPAPVPLPGDRTQNQTEVFDTAFNWSENERAWRAMRLLLKSSQKAWPQLVEHLDDDRYCMTVEVVSGALHNWTVGDVCRQIVGRSLSEAYYRHLIPASRETYGLRMPEFAMSGKELKAWLAARSNKAYMNCKLKLASGRFRKLRP